MRRRTPDGSEYYLAIISKARPERVTPMSKLVGAATWFVSPEDQWWYTEQNAILGPLTSGLSEARNAALEEAFEQDLPCVQLDDDLRGAKLAMPDGKGVPAPPDLCVNLLVRSVLSSDFMLAGGQPTNNPYFARGGTRLFILGSAIAVRPSEPRFDPQFWLKEDYDFTCQHIARYGGALRIHNLIFDFQHYSNRGGAVDGRTGKVEQEMVRRLIEKWPGWIHEHPRRENEVLLRLPDAKRTVLQ